MPIQRFIGRRNPVLIGQAKSEALFDQLLRGGQLQLLQHLADTFPACGNGTLCPPAVKSFPFHTDFIVSAERQMLCVMNFAERDDVGIFVKFQIHDRDVAVHKGIQHENSSFPCDYYFLLYHFSLGIAREMMLIMRHRKKSVRDNPLFNHSFAVHIIDSILSHVTEVPREDTLDIVLGRSAAVEALIVDLLFKPIQCCK